METIAGKGRWRPIAFSLVDLTGLLWWESRSCPAFRPKGILNKNTKLLQKNGAPQLLNVRWVQPQGKVLLTLAYGAEKQDPEILSLATQIMILKPKRLRFIY